MVVRWCPLYNDFVIECCISFPLTFSEKCNEIQSPSKVFTGLCVTSQHVYMICAVLCIVPYFKALCVKRSKLGKKVQFFPTALHQSGLRLRNKSSKQDDQQVL